MTETTESRRRRRGAGHVSEETVPGPRLSLVYTAAYATALVGSLVSAGLTYFYVGTVAREVNPVLAVVIELVGLEGMVVVKTAVVIGGYWGYFWLCKAGIRPVLCAGFAWLGSLINLLDAVHDLRVAFLAGVPPGVDAAPGVALVAAACVAGVLLRPSF